MPSSILIARILLPGLILIGSTLTAQSYTYYLTGNPADAQVPTTDPIVLLAGGGPDNDAAMRRFLQAANGGDIVVLRASGSDGYNEYLFSELGVPVHSVETIRFNGPAAAQDTFVINRIRRAEGLFIAGGDQTDYLTYWKGTPVEAAIHYLALDKGVPVGGTSAGMAILGEAYYAPNDLGVLSSEALSDPFHPYLDTIGLGDFLQLPYLEATITDTHFDQRDRAGRLMTFLARLSLREGTDRPFGIAANEATAIVIDAGRAAVYGEFPLFDDFAYFLHVNCSREEYLPELIEPQQPLNWDQQEQAVIVYRVPGTADGSNFFDVKTWESGSGGTWQFWSVVDGTLLRSPTDAGVACIVPVQEPASRIGSIRCYPNPVRGAFRLLSDGPRPDRIRVFTTTGQLHRNLAPEESVWSTAGWPPGLYLLDMTDTDGRRYAGKLIVE